MTATPQVRMMTPAEIAEILGVSNMTAYRLMHRGDLPAHRIGRSLRVDPRDFADYMRGNSTTADWDES